MGRGDEGMNEEEGFLKDMIAQLSCEGCKEFIKPLIFRMYGLHTNSVNVIWELVRIIHYRAPPQSWIRISEGGSQPSEF